MRDSGSGHSSLAYIAGAEIYLAGAGNSGIIDVSFRLSGFRKPLLKDTLVVQESKVKLRLLEQEQGLRDMSV